MLLHLLMPYIKFPLLGSILNTLYYSLIYAGIAGACVLIYRQLSGGGGVPPRRAFTFVFLALLVSFPAGVVSSRAANMFYYPASRWSIEFFVEQFLNGDHQTFHASLFLPALLLSVIIAALRLDFLRTWDTIFLHIPVAHALGRTGCFLVGCCWGHDIQVEVMGHELAFKNPIPLYAIALNIFVFVLLKRQFRRLYESRTTRFMAPGSIAALYLVLYGAGRFLVEFFRTEKIVAFGLTQAQIVMLGFIFTGALMALVVGRRDYAQPEYRVQTRPA